MRLIRTLSLAATLAACACAQSYTIRTLAGGLPSLDGPATSAELGLIGGVAVDSSGNIYVSLHTSHMIVKINSAGTLSRVAGTGQYGFAGDGGPALQAKIAYPQSIAVDTTGNLYIQDGGSQRIRKVATDGTISTVAGSESSFGVTQGVTLGEWSGTHNLPGLAAMAMLSGMAVDSTGSTIYFVDQAANKIKKLTGGKVTVIAGTGDHGYNGDSIDASTAWINDPMGLFLENSSSGNNLYVADTHNNRVRKIVLSTNVITTVAGTGTGGYSGDNALATAATLLSPMGVVLDSSSNIYIADTGNHVIRKVMSGSYTYTPATGTAVTYKSGAIVTLAGTGTWGFSGDGGTATKGNLSNPGPMAVDASGNIYFADLDNRRVREFVASGTTLATVAGGGAYAADNGVASASRFWLPVTVAARASGVVDMVDMGRNQVREINTATGAITTVAGNGITGLAGDYRSATTAQLHPTDLAIDAAGNTYIANPTTYLSLAGVGRVRVIRNGTILPYAGNGMQGYLGDGDLAPYARMNQAMGVALDKSGNLYIADTNNYVIRMVNATTGTISTIAGNGERGYSGDNGAATSASIGAVTRVAVDSQGRVYIADADNHRVRMVANGVITTVAGTGVEGSSGDGGAPTAAMVSHPTAIAIDANDNVYVWDDYYAKLRVFTSSSIKTIAGTGIRGYAGDGGPALNAQLGRVSDIAIDADGNIYMADLDNHVIRMLTPGK